VPLAALPGNRFTVRQQLDPADQLTVIEHMFEHL